MLFHTSLWFSIPLVFDLDHQKNGRILDFNPANWILFVHILSRAVSSFPFSTLAISGSNPRGAHALVRILL